MAGLHHEVLGHLVRRGAVHVQQNVFVQGNTTVGEVTIEMSPLEIGIVVTTAVIGLIIYGLVKYTVGELIMTLSMVEDQSTTVTVIQHQKPYSNEEKEKEAAVFDEEIIIAREQPITSKIRRTIRHLTNIGGYKARWRGIGAGMITSLFIYCLNINYGYALALLPLNDTTRTILASVLVAVFFSRFHMAWTHIVISPPSPLSWWRRMAVGMFPVKALAIPSAAVALSEFAVIYATRGIHDSFGPTPEHHGQQMSEEQARNELHRGLATLAVGVLLYVALVIPASVTLIRVEASLLPADVDTIVSFDRTLGGAAPASGQTENVQYLAWYRAAWATFGKSARLRLLKLYVKLGAVLLMVEAVFGSLIVAELLAIGMDRMNGSWTSFSSNFSAEDVAGWQRLARGQPPLNQ